MKDPHNIERIELAECSSCGSIGISRKKDDLYWTCDNCGEVGGLFIDPIKFHLKVSKNNIKWNNESE